MTKHKSRGDDHDAPDEAEQYRVGPGRPPREHQFKPGQSGNPKGRKPKSADIDVKQILTRQMRKPIAVTRDGKTETMSAIEVGLEQLINQVAKGDHRARRELMEYAFKFGLPIFGGAEDKIVALIRPDDRDILNGYVARQTDRKDCSAPSPVLAPPDLLDDDTDEGDGT